MRCLCDTANDAIETRSRGKRFLSAVVDVELFVITAPASSRLSHHRRPPSIRPDAHACTGFAIQSDAIPIQGFIPYGYPTMSGTRGARCISAACHAPRDARAASGRFCSLLRGERVERPRGRAGALLSGIQERGNLAQGDLEGVGPAQGEVEVRPASSVRKRPKHVLGDEITNRCWYRIPGLRDAFSN